ASMGTCLPSAPHPDFDSVASFLTSVEPFRQSLARELGIPSPALPARATIIKRTSLGKHTGYSLEFVQFRSSKTSMIISGLLAVPAGLSGQTLPAVVSADGDAGLGALFGLFGRERTPYLNRYGDALAASGTVVFVPYYPFDFPEVAAAEAAAKTDGARTSFSLTVPMLSAAADLLL